MSGLCLDTVKTQTFGDLDHFFSSINWVYSPQKNPWKYFQHWMETLKIKEPFTSVPCHQLNFNL